MRLSVPLHIRFSGSPQNANIMASCFLTKDKTNVVSHYVRSDAWIMHVFNDWETSNRNLSAKQWYTKNNSFLTNLYKKTKCVFPHLTNMWNHYNSIITYRYIGQYQIVNYTSHMNIQVHSLFIAMYYNLCQCYMYIWCNVSVIKWYAMKSIQIFFLLFFLHEVRVLAQFPI